MYELFDTEAEAHEACRVRGLRDYSIPDAYLYTHETPDGKFFLCREPDERIAYYNLVTFYPANYLKTKHV